MSRQSDPIVLRVVVQSTFAIFAIGEVILITRTLQKVFDSFKTSRFADFLLGVADASAAAQAKIRAAALANIELSRAIAGTTTALAGANAALGASVNVSAAAATATVAAGNSALSAAKTYTQVGAAVGDFASQLGVVKGAVQSLSTEIASLPKVSLVGTAAEAQAAVSRLGDLRTEITQLQGGLAILAAKTDASILSLSRSAVSGFEAVASSADKVSTAVPQIGKSVAGAATSVRGGASVIEVALGGTETAFANASREAQKFAFSAKDLTTAVPSAAVALKGIEERLTGVAVAARRAATGTSDLATQQKESSSTLLTSLVPLQNLGRGYQGVAGAAAGAKVAVSELTDAERGLSAFTPVLSNALAVRVAGYKSVDATAAALKKRLAVVSTLNAQALTLSAEVLTQYARIAPAAVLSVESLAQSFALDTAAIRANTEALRGNVAALSELAVMSTGVRKQLVQEFGVWNLRPVGAPPPVSGNQFTPYLDFIRGSYEQTVDASERARLAAVVIRVTAEQTVEELRRAVAALGSSVEIEGLFTRAVGLGQVLPPMGFYPAQGQRAPQDFGIRLMGLSPAFANAKSDPLFLIQAISEEFAATSVFNSARNQLIALAAGLDVTVLKALAADEALKRLQRTNALAAIAIANLSQQLGPAGDVISVLAREVSGIRRGTEDGLGALRGAAFGLRAALEPLRDDVPVFGGALRAVSQLDVKIRLLSATIEGVGEAFERLDLISALTFERLLRLNSSAGLAAAALVQSVGGSTALLGSFASQLDALLRAQALVEGIDILPLALPSASGAREFGSLSEALRALSQVPVTGVLAVDALQELLQVVPLLVSEQVALASGLANVALGYELAALEVDGYALSLQKAIAAGKGLDISGVIAAIAGVSSVSESAATSLLRLQLAFRQTDGSAGTIGALAQQVERLLLLSQSAAALEVLDESLGLGLERRAVLERELAALRVRGSLSASKVDGQLFGIGAANLLSPAFAFGSTASGQAVGLESVAQVLERFDSLTVGRSFAQVGEAVERFSRALGFADAQVAAFVSQLLPLVETLALTRNILPAAGQDTVRIAGLLSSAAASFAVPPQVLAVLEEDLLALRAAPRGVSRPALIGEAIASLGLSVGNLIDSGRIAKTAEDLLRLGGVVEGLPEKFRLSAAAVNGLRSALEISSMLNDVEVGSIGVGLGRALPSLLEWTDALSELRAVSGDAYRDLLRLSQALDGLDGPRLGLIARQFLDFRAALADSLGRAALELGAQDVNRQLQQLQLALPAPPQRLLPPATGRFRPLGTLPEERLFGSPFGGPPALQDVLPFSPAQLQLLQQEIDAIRAGQALVLRDIEGVAFGIGAANAKLVEYFGVATQAGISTQALAAALDALEAKFAGATIALKAFGATLGLTQEQIAALALQFSALEIATPLIPPVRPAGLVFPSVPEVLPPLSLSPTSPIRSELVAFLEEQRRQIEEASQGQLAPAAFEQLLQSLPEEEVVEITASVVELGAELSELGQELEAVSEVSEVAAEAFSAVGETVAAVTNEIGETSEALREGVEALGGLGGVGTEAAEALNQTAAAAVSAQAAVNATTTATAASTAATAANTATTVSNTAATQANTTVQRVQLRAFQLNVQQIRQQAIALGTSTAATFKNAVAQATLGTETKRTALGRALYNAQTVLSTQLTIANTTAATLSTAVALKLGAAYVFAGLGVGSLAASLVLGNVALGAFSALALGSSIALVGFGNAATALNSVVAGLGAAFLKWELGIKAVNTAIVLTEGALKGLVFFPTLAGTFISQTLGLGKAFGVVAAAAQAAVLEVQTFLKTSVAFQSAVVALTTSTDKLGSVSIAGLTVQLGAAAAAVATLVVSLAAIAASSYVQEGNATKRGLKELEIAYGEIVAVGGQANAVIRASQALLEEIQETENIFFEKIYNGTISPEQLERAKQLQDLAKRVAEDSQLRASQSFQQAEDRLKAFEGIGGFFRFGIGLKEAEDQAAAFRKQGEAFAQAAQQATSYLGKLQAVVEEVQKARQEFEEFSKAQKVSAEATDVLASSQLLAAKRALRDRVISEEEFAQRSIEIERQRIVQRLKLLYQEQRALDSRGDVDNAFSNEVGQFGAGAGRFMSPSELQEKQQELYKEEIALKTRLVELDQQRAEAKRKQAEEDFRALGEIQRQTVQAQDIIAKQQQTSVRKAIENRVITEREGALRIIEIEQETARRRLDIVRQQLGDLEAFRNLFSPTELQSKQLELLQQEAQLQDELLTLRIRRNEEVTKQRLEALDRELNVRRAIGEVEQQSIQQSEASLKLEQNLVALAQEAESLQLSAQRSSLELRQQLLRAVGTEQEIKNGNLELERLAIRELETEQRFRRLNLEITQQLRDVELERQRIQAEIALKEQEIAILKLQAQRASPEEIALNQQLLSLRQQQLAAVLKQADDQAVLNERERENLTVREQNEKRSLLLKQALEGVFQAAGAAAGGAAALAQGLGLSEEQAQKLRAALGSITPEMDRLIERARSLAGFYQQAAIAADGIAGSVGGPSLRQQETQALAQEIANPFERQAFILGERLKELRDAGGTFSDRVQLGGKNVSLSEAKLALEAASAGNRLPLEQLVGAKAVAAIVSEAVGSGRRQGGRLAGSSSDDASGEVSQELVRILKDGRFVEIDAKQLREQNKSLAIQSSEQLKEAIANPLSGIGESLSVIGGDTSKLLEATEGVKETVIKGVGSNELVLPSSPEVGLVSAVEESAAVQSAALTDGAIALSQSGLSAGEELTRGAVVSTGVLEAGVAGVASGVEALAAELPRQAKEFGRLAAEAFRLDVQVFGGQEGDSTIDLLSNAWAAALEEQRRGVTDLARQQQELEAIATTLRRIDAGALVTQFGAGNAVAAEVDKLMREVSGFRPGVSLPGGGPPSVTNNIEVNIVNQQNPQREVRNALAELTKVGVSGVSPR